MKYFTNIQYFFFEVSKQIWRVQRIRENKNKNRKTKEKLRIVSFEIEQSQVPIGLPVWNLLI